MEDFLFQRRAGHCEYFASAMAIMLRSVGVPSRVVNGFRGGEWNSFGKYYVVRERNAHAWVEAFVPGRGWVTFDPTPAGRPPDTGLPGFLVLLSQVVDTLRWRWHRYVIDFDASSQRLLAGRFLRQLGRARSRVQAWRARFGTAWPAGSGLTFPGGWIAAGVLCGVLLLWLSRLRARKGMDGMRARVDFYDALLRLLARRGFVKEAWFTPREFAARIAAQEGDRARPVIEVTEAYYRVRYGGQDLAAGERRALDDSMRRLQGLRRNEGRLKELAGIPACSGE